MGELTAIRRLSTARRGKLLCFGASPRIQTEIYVTFLPINLTTVGKTLHFEAQRAGTVRWHGFRQNPIHACVINDLRAIRGTDERYRFARR
jgi:hypothetical protein